MCMIEQRTPFEREERYEVLQLPKAVQVAY